MKISALLLAGTSMVIASPALAREGQAYVGINAGVSLEDQVDIDAANTNPQQNAAFADTEIGLDADIVVGYDFGPIRLEAEGGYKRAGYEGLTVLIPAIVPGSPVPAGTVVQNEEDLSILSGMVNALVDLGRDDGPQVFAGGGFGIVNIDLPVEVAGVGTVIDDDETDFAWQLIGGLRFPVNDKIDLGLKYRYFVIDEFQINTANAIPAEVDYQVHSILASLTYNFGSKAQPAPPPPPAPVTPPPPPAPPPAPAPAPVVQCNTGPYIVFFDFDQSAITAEAAQILDGAVTAYSNCGTARVMLAGHTDRAGSVSYNTALAQRRNDSVRSYMAGRGVADSRISSKAFGEAQPRVPTQDGVREQQNRRVEITYGPGSGM